MANVGTYRKPGPLVLTVIEYFADQDTVHVHCERQLRPDPARCRSLAGTLVAGSEVLEHRSHRLYYAIPEPFGAVVMPLDDPVSFEAFSERYRRNVRDVYAVLANSTTSDPEKVVKLYLDRMPTPVDVDRTERFQRTIAKPFSHRPAEPETDPVTPRKTI